jgi:HEAT repeat protein
MKTSPIQRLLNELRSSDPERQWPALVKLEELRDPVAIPEVLPLLSSSDEMVRWNSVEALGALNDAELRPVAQALMLVLNDPDESVRNAAVEALMPLALPAAKEPIRNILRHDPYWVARASAAEALSWFEDLELIDDLQQALEDEEPIVQMYAACSLGMMATPTILPALERALVMSNDLRVKGELIIATYRLGAPDSLRRLLKLIEYIDQEFEGIAILNMLQFLIEWNPPASLRKDAPQVRAALRSFIQEPPHKTIELLLSKLDELEQSPEQEEPEIAMDKSATPRVNAGACFGRPRS